MMAPIRRALALTMWTTTLVASAMACNGDRTAGADDSARASRESTRRDSDAAVTAGSVDSTSSPTNAAGTTPRLVILGTSLTAGLGLDPALAYPALLQRKADSAGAHIEIVNAGLSGETSAGALRRAGWVLDQPAAAVVLEVGANDGLRGVDPDSTFANLVALVKVIRAAHPDAKIALVQMEAPTNLGRDYTTRFHAAYERAAATADVPLLPFLLERVAGDARYNQADGIHPNREGSVRVAENMWRALQPIIAETSPR